MSNHHNSTQTNLHELCCQGETLNFSITAQNESIMSKLFIKSPLQSFLGVPPPSSHRHEITCCNYEYITSIKFELM